MDPIYRTFVSCRQPIFEALLDSSSDLHSPHFSARIEVLYFMGRRVSPPSGILALLRPTTPLLEGLVFINRCVMVLISARCAGDQIYQTEAVPIVEDRLLSLLIHR